MDKLYIEDIIDLACIMYERATKGKKVSAALFYDEATELMRELLCYDDVSIRDIDIKEERSCGYKKEYYVILDSTLSISVIKSWQKTADCSDYIHYNTDVMYLDGNVSSAIVSKQDNTNGKQYEVVFNSLGESSDEEYGDNDIDDNKTQHDSVEYKFDILSVIDQIIDALYEYVESSDEVLDFIERKFPTKKAWEFDNCYYFSVILKDRFPGGDIFYDVINGHFTYKYKDRYYDHTGIVKPDGYLVKWDAFDEYDSIQHKRIIRDCIA